MAGSIDKKEVAIDIPLNGKLCTYEDPLLIGPSDFRQLVNLRYTATNPKGVAGMTKITTTAPAYPVHKTGIHFTKDSPYESHLLLQSYNAAENKCVIQDMTTEPPGTQAAAMDVLYVIAEPWQSGTSVAVGEVRFPTTNNGTYLECIIAGTTGGTEPTWATTEYGQTADNTAVWITRLGNLDGTFSYAPNGYLAYGNGHHNLIYGGNESKIGKFLNVDPSGDASVPDPAPTPSWVNVSYDTFTASGANILNAVASGASSATSTMTVTDGQQYVISFLATITSEAPSVAISNTTPAVSMTLTNGFNNALFTATDTTIVITISNTSASIYSAQVQFETLGGGGASITSGINYDYTDRVNSDEVTDEFTATLKKAADGHTYLYIGTVLPISGVKMYVRTPNATGSALTVSYWGGSAWVSVGTVTDGTKDSITLAQTGSFTWADTSAVARPKLINNTMLYWYTFDFATGVDETTQIYYATVAVPFQPVRDLWDGAPLDIVNAVYYRTGTTGTLQENITTNVLKTDAVPTLIDANNWSYPPECTWMATYMSAAGELYLGFSERCCGLYFNVLTANLTNTGGNNLSTNAEVYYWSGSAWTSVGTLNDQTKNAVTGASLAHAGYISWNPIDAKDEERTKHLDSAQLFYYKVMFSAGLTDNLWVHIDQISGIPSPLTIEGYNFPVLYNNALWWAGRKTGRRNELISSAPGAISIYNGVDSVKRFIGSDAPLVSGCSLFSRYGQDVSATMIIHKVNETWLINGHTPDTIVSFCVSGQYGNTAIHSLAVCDLGYEIAPGINKAVAIWQSQMAIVCFDNGTIIDVSGQNNIENFFLDMWKESVTDRLNILYTDKSQGFFDAVNLEYHWLFIDGS